MHDLCPFLLVERLNLSAIAAQDHPQPVCEDDFGVGKVRDDLRYRPLARCRTAGQHPARRCCDQATQLRGRRSQYLHGVLPRRQAEHTCCVLLYGFDHESSSGKSCRM
jgi:hypothetical protein